MCAYQTILKGPRCHSCWLSANMVRGSVFRPQNAIMQFCLAPVEFNVTLVLLRNLKEYTVCQGLNLDWILSCCTIFWSLFPFFIHTNISTSASKFSFPSLSSQKRKTKLKTKVKQLPTYTHPSFHPSTLYSLKCWHYLTTQLQETWSQLFNWSQSQCVLKGWHFLKPIFRRQY